MPRNFEFLTYRHFDLRPAYIGWNATHKDYDGPEDRRIFNSTSPKDPEEDLCYQIDQYYDGEERSALAGLVGLVDMILHRDDLPAEIKRIMETHWRFTDALDILDSSRGTIKIDSEEATAILRIRAEQHL